jgi:hypothetical protein
LSFTDLEQLQLSYEPKALTFGLGSNDKCPVDEELHDEIVLTNNGTTARKFIFFVPAEDETLRCRLHPGAGVIKSVRTDAHPTLQPTNQHVRTVSTCGQ